MLSGTLTKPCAHALLRTLLAALEVGNPVPSTVDS